MAGKNVSRIVFVFVIVSLLSIRPWASQHSGPIAGEARDETDSPSQTSHLEVTMQNWSKTYGGIDDDAAFALVQTNDGGYALAGSTKSYGAGSYDFLLVKTDSSGNAQWNRTYGGTSHDYVYSLVQTGDGGYALAGCTYSFGVGNSDVWLVKTDEAGIVPEFPSLLILPVFMVTTLLTLSVRRRRPQNRAT